MVLICKNFTFPICYVGCGTAGGQTLDARDIRMHRIPAPGGNALYLSKNRRIWQHCSVIVLTINRTGRHTTPIFSDLPTYCILIIQLNIRAKF